MSSHCDPDSMLTLVFSSKHSCACSLKDLLAPVLKKLKLKTRLIEFSSLSFAVLNAIVINNMISLFIARGKTLQKQSVHSLSILTLIVFPKPPWIFYNIMMVYCLLHLLVNVNVYVAMLVIWLCRSQYLCLAGTQISCMPSLTLLTFRHGSRLLPWLWFTMLTFPSLSVSVLVCHKATAEQVLPLITHGHT